MPGTSPVLRFHSIPSMDPTMVHRSPSQLFPICTDGPSMAIDGFQLWPNALWSHGSLLEMQISNFNLLTFPFQPIYALLRLKITHFLPKLWFFSIGCCSASSSGDVRNVSGRHIMHCRQKMQFSFEIHQKYSEIVSKTEIFRYNNARSEDLSI